MGTQLVRRQRRQCNGRAWRGTAAVVLLCVPVGVAAGCGNQRSVENYCSTMVKHRDRYLTSMNDAGKSDVLSGLAKGLSAVADLRDMWKEMADVAPEEIRVDTEKVRDAYAKQVEITEQNAGKPMAAAAKGLVAGAMASGSVLRVDSYVRKNCSNAAAKGAS